ncbi:MAG: hypothetical protein HQL56_07115 [Magnetococcales bacterium]|nr:hypothetical protein [Magnetococcales bacterium]
MPNIFSAIIRITNRFFDEVSSFANSLQILFNAEKQLEKNGMSLNVYAAMFGAVVGGIVGANVVGFGLLLKLGAPVLVNIIGIGAGLLAGNLAEESYKNFVKANHPNINYSSLEQATYHTIFDRMQESISKFGDTIKRMAISTETYATGLLGTISQRWLDPVAIDLDGDGLETTSGTYLDDPIFFDHDGDGLSNGTGWVKSDDGWLVLDRNGNGTIDSGLELFGNNTVLTNGFNAPDGFSALREQDSNQDGVITSGDEVFANLRIWRDLNQDGVSDTGELFTLSELGIQSIGLQATASNTNLGNNIIVSAQGSVTRADATGAVVVDADAAANLNLPINTFYREYPDTIPLTEQALSLPNLAGSGRVRDLSEAVSLSPALGDWVTDYMAQTTRQAQIDRLDEFVKRWANTSDFGSMRDQAAEKGVTVTYFLQGLTAGTLEYDAFLTKLGVVERFVGFVFGGSNGQALPQFPSGYGSTANSTINIALQANQISAISLAYDRLKGDVYESLVLTSRLSNYTVILNGSYYYLEEEQTWLLNPATLEASFQQSIAADSRQGLIDLVEFISAAGQTWLATNGWSAIQFLLNQINAAPDMEGFREELNSWTVGLAGAGEMHLQGDDRNNLLVGTLGDNTLTGSQKNDVLAGKAGNDTLDGQGGDDILDGGEGNDTLVDIHGGNDVLVGGAGNDILTDRGKGGNGLFGGEGNDTLSVGCAAGDEADNTLDGGSGDDVISIDGTNDAYRYSANYVNAFHGGTGSDRLYGLSGMDIYFYDLGDGNDTLRDNDCLLAAKEDTVVFGEGISLADVVFTRGGNHLQATITDASGGPSGSIFIQDWFSGSEYQIETFLFADGSVLTKEEAQALAMRIVGTAGIDALWGSNLDETILGLAGNDNITDNGGSDTIDGGDGDDAITDRYFGTNILRGGSGNDTISASYYSANTLEGGEGNDVMRLDSTDSQSQPIIGSTFRGGTGSDVMYGRGGADTYYYDPGDGFDAIWDSGGANSDKIDRVMFGVGISLADVAITRNGNNLYAGIMDASGNQTGRISVQEWFTSDSYRIETFQFADGSSLSKEELQALAMRIVGTAGIDALWGSNLDETILGLAGNDNITDNGGSDTIDGGDGDDTIIDNYEGTNILRGGDGNDTIRASYYASNTLEGGAGNDVMKLDSTTYGSNSGFGAIFRGGTGSDVMYGRGGADTYYYDPGDGFDAIWDSGGANSDKIDRVVFGAGISLADVVFSKNGNTLNASIRDAVGNPTGGISVQEWFSADSYRIETFQFADGSSLSKEEVEVLSKRIVGTAGNDTLYGTALDDAILGLGGNDTITDNSGGSDIIDGGDGNDTISDYGSGANTLLGGSGDDTITFSYAGNNTLEGGEGNDLLKIQNVTYAGSANFANTFCGGLGNDRMVAGYGADTYHYDFGGGDDRIYDYNPLPTGKSDKVIFGNGIAMTDLSYGKTGLDLVIAVKSGVVGGGSVTIENWFNSDAAYRLEQFQFADGTSLSGVEVHTLATTLTGTAGGDVLAGWEDNNVIAGLSGNDTITDSNGSDTIDGGDGNDTITDSGSGTNILLGGAGDDIVTSGYSSNNTFLGGEGNDLLQIQSASDNTASGYSNSFRGGLGNDRLVGRGGSDTYLYDRGDGDDVIFDLDNYATGKMDQLVFGAGILASDLTFGRSGNHLVVTVGDAGNPGLAGHITIEEWFGTPFYRMERFTFADGTFLDATALDLLGNTRWGGEGNDTLTGYDNTADILYGLDGNDSLSGKDGDDLLDGGAGNDILDGGWGRDTLIGGAGDDTLGGVSGSLDANSWNNTYRGGSGNDLLRGTRYGDNYLFGRGDGVDRLEEQSGVSGQVDRIVFDAGIGVTDVVLARQGDDLLVDYGAGDQVTLSGWGSDSSRRVEEIHTGAGDVLVSSMVDQIIQAMATFGVDQGGLSWRDAVQQRPEEAMVVLAAHWQLAS